MLIIIFEWRWFREILIRDKKKLDLKVEIQVISLEK